MTTTANRTDCDDLTNDEAFSPAGSEASVASSGSAMSISSDSSNHHQTLSEYSEDSNPSVSSHFNWSYPTSRLDNHVSAPQVAISAPIPKATHKPEYDQRLQMEFEDAVSKAVYDKLDNILSRHSENININLYNEDGQTPLQHFCMMGHLELVKLLVRYGADIKLRTREGWSLIHIASFSGSPDMVSFVLRCSRNCHS